MRTLTVTTFVTLDGVMQAPGGPEEGAPDFLHGGWSVTYWDDLMSEIQTRAMSDPFDLVLGRKTYDIFAAYWPKADDDAGARPLNEATKYVASRRRPELTWENSVLLDGDAGDAIAELKTRPGPELQVHGSGNLVQTLRDRRLVDRYRLWIFPVVLGQGARLFPDSAVPEGFTLLTQESSTTGVIIATYEPAGQVPTGSFTTN